MSPNSTSKQRNPSDTPGEIDTSLSATGEFPHLEDQETESADTSHRIEDSKTPSPEDEVKESTSFGSE